MSIILTEKAANQVKRVMTESSFQPDVVLRVAVVGGGCSGYSYHLGFDTNSDAEKDLISEQHGVKVAVDRRSDLYLDGTVVDYYDGIEKSGFKFENPNVQKSCGCGSSFSV